MPVIYRLPDVKQEVIMEDNRENTQENEEMLNSQEEQKEHSYSQQEVDEIVRKRLARERR